MHARNPAFFAYQEAIKSLPSLSERQQIRVLKFELFDAFDRADEWQRSHRALESRITELEARGGVAGEGTEDAFARYLHAEMARARSELADARAAHETELSALRRELHAAELKKEVLDALCRSLVLTIEQAAGGDLRENGNVDRASESEAATS